MHPNSVERGKGRRKGNATTFNVLSNADAQQGTFAVIDPHSKKLFIPMGSMIDTRAMHREGVPSLCRIFLLGRCRQGANCFQAHADVDTVVRLREAALSEPSCCPEHGAPSNAAGVPPSLVLVINNDEGRSVGRVNLSHVGVTNGLHSLIVAQGLATSFISPEVVVPMSALCRLHFGHGGSKCCRFGPECNFVHICRELNAEIAARSLGHEMVVAPPRNGDSASTAGTDAVAAPAPPDSVAQAPPRISVPGTGSSMNAYLSASVGCAMTPPLNFDPLALAATAPTNGDAVMPYPLGMSPVRSFSSTPSGLVWRHNPYGSSKASSVVET